MAFTDSSNGNFPTAKIIEKKLKEKIQQDLFTYQIIGNEEDLQQSVYHHLRNFIDEQKLTHIKIRRY